MITMRGGGIRKPTYTIDNNLNYEFFYKNMVENFDIENLYLKMYSDGFGTEYSFISYKINGRKYSFGKDGGVIKILDNCSRLTSCCSEEECKFFCDFLNEKNKQIFKIYKSLSCLKLSKESRETLTKELYKKNDGKTKKLSDEEVTYYKLKYL